MCPDAWFSWTHLGPTIVFYSIINTNKSDGRSARTRTMNFGPKRSFYSKFWMLWPDIWSIIWTRQQCSPCSLCPSTSTTTTSNCHAAAHSDRANARALFLHLTSPSPPSSRSPLLFFSLPTAKKQWTISDESKQGGPQTKRVWLCDQVGYSVILFNRYMYTPCAWFSPAELISCCTSAHFLFIKIPRK